MKSSFVQKELFFFSRRQYFFRGTAYLFSYSNYLNRCDSTHHFAQCSLQLSNQKSGPLIDRLSNLTPQLYAAFFKESNLQLPSHLSAPFDLRWKTRNKPSVNCRQ